MGRTRLLHTTYNMPSQDISPRATTVKFVHAKDQYMEGQGPISPCHSSEMGNLGNLGTLDTPPKFNMEPEKKCLEKEVPLGNHHFQISC